MDPRHRGAHEYIGELYLKLNQLDKAKYHLSKLDSICFFGCEEYDELKEALKNFLNPNEESTQETTTSNGVAATTAPTTNTGTATATTTATKTDVSDAFDDLFNS